VKTSSGVVGLERLLRDAIQNVDPNVAVGAVRPMSEAVAAALAARRFSILLIGSFAAAALFLAAAGLYAVMAYGIQQRNREIGVRLALGATRAMILRMIFKEGALLSCKRDNRRFHNRSGAGKTRRQSDVWCQRA
jgi:putative ABC transport system permease protein